MSYREFQSVDPSPGKLAEHVRANRSRYVRLAPRSRLGLSPQKILVLVSTGVTSFGAQAFAWTAQWDAAGAERAIAAAAAQGLDFIEIPLLDIDGFPLEETLALAKAHGMAFTTAPGLPANCHLPFNPDGALKYLSGAIELTAALGSDALTGALYAHPGTMTRKPPTDEELKVCASTLKQAARLAAKRGISLGIEAINRYETYLINTASQVADLLDRINEANVFAHLDTYHMNIEEKGFRGPIEFLGDRLQYIHLSESDRGTPGTGNIRWDDVFGALRSIGYRGRMAMESFVAVNEVIGTIGMWRTIVEDPNNSVGNGLDFLRGKSREYNLLTGRTIRFM